MYFMFSMAFSLSPTDRSQGGDSTYQKPMMAAMIFMATPIQMMITVSYEMYLTKTMT